MVHLFISYEGGDREFAREIEQKIKEEFEGKITTRIVEDFNDFTGRSWKEKVINDLEKSSIFLTIFTKSSKKGQWPNQEVGYAFALNKMDRIKEIIPIVEIDKWENGKPVFIQHRFSPPL